MFLVAVPIAALAFLATWLIPQVELKQWPEAPAGSATSGGPAAAQSVAGAQVLPEALDPETAQATGPDQPPAAG